MILHRHHRSLRTLFSSSIFMGSKHLLKCSPCAATIPSSSFLYHHLYTHLPQLFFSPLPPKPISRILPFASTSSGFCSSALSKAPTTFDFEVQVEKRTDLIDEARLATLKQKLEQHGFCCATAKPAKNTLLICPKCKGGSFMERSLALTITPDCNTAVWLCHRTECGWKGKIRAVIPNRKITKQSIGLKPLCEELLEYFKERMITKETLRRNAVMQKSTGHEIVIAFTYRRNGKLVSCKYRNVDKVFWQEKNTERILYGLDDIKQVSDIIIVEGEIDKLSMEEAGLRNCVSVPGGAPPKVSNEDLPPTEKDGRVNAFYSTPSIYTDAKYATNESWPIKAVDFFPYADRANSYWTGYCTSRPALKRYVRVMSGYYLAARQLEFFKGRSDPGPT